MEKIMLTVKLLSDPTNLRALLGPFSVPLMRVVWLVLGMGLGFFLVYLPAPLLGIVFTSGDPIHLTSGNKIYWVESTALLHANGVISDEDAKLNLEKAGYGPSEIQALADTRQDQPEVQAALANVVNLPNQDEANRYQSKISTNIFLQIFPLCCLFIFFLVGIVVAIGLSFRPIPIGPWRSGAVATDSRTGAFGAKEIERRKALKEAAEHVSEGAEEVIDLGEPIATFMSAYVIGDDLYDDSFALEPDDRFVGECGIGISEIIGVGDPKKVTAFEVWVFDQEEIQTLTYVLMSEHAYNDPSLRDKLAPRGEAVMATAGGTFYLDTRKLKLRAKIIDLTYGEGSLPPNSFMEKVTISLTAWLKEGDGGVGMPAMPTPVPQPLPQSQPMSPLPQGAPMGAPPQYGGGNPPMPPYPPQQGGIRPLQQPPMQGGMPPQQAPYPPQQPAPYPPQQPGPYPPQQGGIRPLQPPPMQGGMPPQQPPPTGRAPMPPQQQGNAPLPGRQAPPTDDPFGDTGQM